MRMCVCVCVCVCVDDDDDACAFSGGKLLFRECNNLPFHRTQKTLQEQNYDIIEHAVIRIQKEWGSGVQVFVYTSPPVLAL